MEEDKENIEGEEIISTDNTDIKISNEVVASIAGVAVSEVKGVSNVSGGLSGISEVFGGKKNLTKGIKVEVGEKETKIDVSIVVEYGVRIPDVAFEIQSRVKKAVESMTGLKVSGVNIHVQGIKTNSQELKEKQETREEGEE